MDRIIGHLISDVLVALALTTSATLTWHARRAWGHQIVNPTLLYLGTALTSFAVYRWILVFDPDHVEDPWSVLFIMSVQTGVILVLLAGQRFHKAAQLRVEEWEDNVTDEWVEVPRSLESWGE